MQMHVRKTCMISFLSLVRTWTGLMLVDLRPPCSMDLVEMIQRKIGSSMPRTKYPEALLADMSQLWQAREHKCKEEKKIGKDIDLQ